MQINHHTWISLSNLFYCYNIGSKKPLWKEKANKWNEIKVNTLKKTDVIKKLKTQHFRDSKIFFSNTAVYQMDELPKLIVPDAKVFLQNLA